MTIADRPRLIDHVLESLLDTIQTSGLHPGDSLPRERELALQLGVSRSMIRQAFRVLEDRGIVDARQGSGRYLRSAETGDRHVSDALEVASIVDILETRSLLERNGVALACERRTTAEATQIRNLASTLNSWQDNKSFHVAIARATHNFMLERLVSQQIDLSDQLHQRDRYADAEAVELMKAEHRAIAEMIMTRNVEAASELMNEHLRQTSKTVLASQQRRDG